MTCPTRTYLLVGAPGFAGRHRPDDLVDVFTTEAAARAAFRRLRLEVGSAPGWAELIALEGDVARPLCWFGVRPAGDLRVAPADEKRSVLGREAITQRAPDAPGEKERSIKKNGITTLTDDSLAITELESSPPRWRPGITSGSGSIPAQRSSRRRPGWRASVTVGLFVIIGVPWLLDAGKNSSPSNSAPTSASLTGATIHGGGLVGHEVVRAENVSYAPDTSRSWGTSDGLHQVTVLVGTLSVDDGDGHLRDYGAGESYAAGWASYVARNVTAGPVEVIVSYLRPAVHPSGHDTVTPSD